MARTGSTTITATDAKNQFGMIMKRAKDGPVFIVKHGKAKAVVLDAETYEALLHKAREPHEAHLDELAKEFDELFAQMQTAASRKAASSLLAASAEELNRSARKRSKRRG